MSKNLEFMPTGLSASGKTGVWTVLAQRGGVLGGVKWFTSWRKYSFFPAPDCVFEQDCLREIADFIESRTREHGGRPMSTHQRTTDYSWEHEANPDNTRWLPGYRFFVRQESVSKARSHGRMRPRYYYVQFRIAKDGTLEWIGGVKATPETMVHVQGLYKAAKGLRDV